MPFSVAGGFAEWVTVSGTALCHQWVISRDLIRASPLLFREKDQHLTLTQATGTRLAEIQGLRSAAGEQRQQPYLPLRNFEGMRSLWTRSLLSGLTHTRSGPTVLHSWIRPARLAPPPCPVLSAGGNRASLAHPPRYPPATLSARRCRNDCALVSTPCAIPGSATSTLQPSDTITRYSSTLSNSLGMAQVLQSCLPPHHRSGDQTPSERA